MNRRQMIPTVGLALTAAAVAQQAAPKPVTNAAALAKSAGACVSTGDACLAHCHDMLASGDKSMGECAKTVSELIAVCTALEKLAAQNAPSLARQAAVAAEVCKRCEAQCRKFAAMPPCKACADACNACMAECAKSAKA